MHHVRRSARPALAPRHHATPGRVTQRPVGTHEQLVVLWRGERLARWLGTPERFRVHTFPVVLSVPWGLTTGYLPCFPLPAQTTVGFGAPLRWPDLGPADADDPAALARFFSDVHAGIQRELDELSAGRIPWLGRAGEAR